MRSRRWYKKKRVWALLFLLALIAVILSFPGARLLMQQAPLSSEERPMSPPISMAEMPTYKDKLQDHIYGPIMPFDITTTGPARAISEHQFSNLVEIEERKISGSFGAVPQSFHMVLVTPKGDGPFPIIISQNFCPNHQVIPVEGLHIPSGNYFDCSSDGMAFGVFRYFFGRYITEPPIEMIAERGYAMAVLYPHEIVPDNAAEGLPRLAQLFPDHGASERPGALSVWASQEIAVAKLLKTDPRYSQIITYGHSRYGKTALMAAAFSDDIDGAIAHQSGTGGASSLKDSVGESIEAITASYPHWFSPKFGEFSDREADLPVDSHMLLSLIAPRPVLLGNARRDVWSDPEGAFNAAHASKDAYEHYGMDGLVQDNLGDFTPNANLAFWMRAGTHGVVEEDWPAFLEFLDAHFK